MKKELTPLEALENYYTDGLSLCAFKEEDMEMFEECLKQLKALDIIKEKDVNVYNFKHWIISKNWTYDDYISEENDANTTGHQFAYKILTQEEYDLLKEVLK